VATYFWVNGNGNWNATDTTNWALSSGGAGGAGVPTLTDDVIFDANSNTGTDPFTVTVTGTSASPAVCRDFTASGLDGALTLSMTVNTARLDIYGSITLPATNFTISAIALSRITFKATTTGKTITSNGVNFSNASIYFDGAGGEWSLIGAFTQDISGRVYVNSGSFKTDNYSFTVAYFISEGNLAKSITLGSSSVTLSTGSGVSFTGTNLTFDAGTSNVTSGSSNTQFTANGTTWYNVNFSTGNTGNTITILGNNTFNNLTFAGPTATFIRGVTLGDNQTVNGTLTLGTANTAIRRMFVRSDVVGTPRTITAATVATLADVDFRDIVGAGLGTWSGTRLGNCGGNTGITFDAAKTVYYNDTNGGIWTDTAWALSSGGAVDINNFPLAQDTVIFDNTGWTSGSLATNAFWNYGTLDFSSLTNAVTFSTAGQLSFVYGDIILSPSLSISGSLIIFFNGNNKTQTVTSAGKTFTQGFNIDSPTVTVKLQGNLISTGANGFTLTQGTLDLNNFDLTCLTFSSSNSNVRSIAFGTGEINVTGNNATVLTFDTATNYSHTGTPRINFTYSGSTGTRTIFAPRVGVNTAYIHDLYFLNGSDIAVQGNGNATIGTLDFTGFSGSFAWLETGGLNIGRTLNYSSTMTVVSSTRNLVFNSESGTQTLTTNGKTLDFPVTKTGAGTLQLLDNATIGSTRTITHTAGTLDLNDFTLTVGTYSSTGSTARQLDFGTGDLNITGATFTASGSNYTTAGTGSISMTSASAKTFAGGGFTYPTLNQGGVGQLTITGANTFADITNTTQPCTVVFPANTTTTVADFNLSGTAGNLVSLRSSTNGQRFTLLKV
jgi:hypothetical protein